MIKIKGFDSIEEVNNFLERVNIFYEDLKVTSLQDDLLHLLNYTLIYREDTLDEAKTAMMGK